MGTTTKEFSSYDEALQWIEMRVKSFSSHNHFYASDEYKAIYPHVQELYAIQKQKEKSVLGELGMSKLKEAGLQIVDIVVYDFISPFFDVIEYSGKIVDRGGVPFVLLDKGQRTLNGKKSIMWYKGFIKKV